MDIKVNVIKTYSSGKIKAMCEIRLDDIFVIHSVRLIEGKNGLFVAMPDETKTDKDGNSRRFDVVHPINADARSTLNELVIAEYRKHIETN